MALSKARPQSNRESVIQLKKDHCTAAESIQLGPRSLALKNRQIT